MRFEILSNGQIINIIVADECFTAAYCQANGYTYKEAPLSEPKPEPEKTVWDELDAAYREGVNAV